MPACNSPKGLPAEISRGMALLMCALSCAWQPSMAGAPPLAPPRPVIMTAPSWYELEDDLDAENFDEDDPRIWFLPPTSNFIFMPDFGSSTFVPRKSDRVPKPTNLDNLPAPQSRGKPKLIDTAVTSWPEPLQPTVLLPPHAAQPEPFQPDLPEPAPEAKRESLTSRRGRTMKRNSSLKDFVMSDDDPDADDEYKPASGKHKRRAPAKKAPALLKSNSTVSAPACPPHVADSARLPDFAPQGQVAPLATADRRKSSSKRRRDEDSSGDEELPSKRRAVVPPTPATSPRASSTPASAESTPTPSVLLDALSSASSMSLTSDSSASSAPPSAPTVDLAPLKAMRTASRRASRKAGANPY